MAWTTIHLRVTTPLFNGGADATADVDGGLRVSSLRGAMRFWFRALAGVGVGANVAGLARLERRVFGATDHASPVKLRLPNPPTPVTNPQPAWCSGHDGRAIIYLLGQGHGNLRHVTVTKPYLEPDTDVRLQVRFGDDEPVASAVLASLWLVCAYGGVGARTRRGFGGLRILGVDGPLPSPWTPQTLRSPALDFYDTVTRLWPAGPIGPCVPQVKEIAQRTARDDPPVPFTLAPADSPPPAYPVFSKQHTAAGLSGGEAFTSWHGLLAHVGVQLRLFRARRATPGVTYHPKVKTPEWRDVVWGPDNHFGLGALGLPVVYKAGNVVNAHRAGVELRRASPLWLRPVGEGRQWRLLSYAFHGVFLPDDVRVELRRERRHVKDVTVSRRDVVQRTGEWIRSLAADEDFSQKLRH